MPEVQAAYDDNASYAEDASEAKAKIFVTACRILLRRVPKRSLKGGRDGSEIELDPRAIADELAEARRWLQINSTSSARVAHRVPADDFRG